MLLALAGPTPPPRVPPCHFSRLWHAEGKDDGGGEHVTAQQRSERFERGLEVIRRMFPGEETREMPIAAPVRRDWGLYTVESVMGDVWSRPGLGLRERSAIT